MHLDENLRLKCFLCDAGFWRELRAGTQWGQGDSLPLTSIHPPFLNPRHCCIWELHSHLDRPQKSRASGKEGMFKIEGLCGTSLPSSHLPQPVQEIPHLVQLAANGLPTLWASDVLLQSECDPEKAGFQGDNMQMSYLKPSPSFLFSSVFKHKDMYVV